MLASITISYISLRIHCMPEPNRLRSVQNRSALSRILLNRFPQKKPCEAFGTICISFSVLSFAQSTYWNCGWARFRRFTKTPCLCHSDSGLKWGLLDAWEPIHVVLKWIRWRGTREKMHNWYLCYNCAFPTRAVSVNLNLPPLLCRRRRRLWTWAPFHVWPIRPCAGL